MEHHDPLLLIFCLAIGLPSLTYWAWSVFTDGPHPANEDPEDIINSIPPPRTPDLVGSETGGFNPKNFTALFAPSLGILLLSIPPLVAAMEAETRVDENSQLYKLLALVFFLLFLLFMLGLFGVILGMTPVTLPRWMYPEWQRARRTIRRREQAQQKAAEGHDPATGTYYDPASRRRRKHIRARDAIPWPPPAWTSNE